MYMVDIDVCLCEVWLYLIVDNVCFHFVDVPYSHGHAFD